MLISYLIGYTIIKIALRTWDFFPHKSHLWNDSDAGSQIMESKLSNVHPVYVNPSFRRFQDAENSQGQWWLPCAGPSHNADLKVWPCKIMTDKNNNSIFGKYDELTILFYLLFFADM